MTDNTSDYAPDSKKVAHDKSKSQPPILIRGVTPPSLGYKPNSYGLDWLQYSVKWPMNLVNWPREPKQEAAIILSCLPRNSAIQFTGERLHPLRGYADGHQLTYGRAFWHPAKRDQKIGIILSGQDLSSCGLENIQHENLLIFAVDVGSKISRLDFALDIFDPKAVPMTMYNSWKRGFVETGAKEVTPLAKGTKDAEGKVTEAQTVYFGSKKSDRRVRIYDKQQESGTDYAWTRIEFTAREERALALAQDMRQHGIKNAGIAAIKEFIRCDSVLWWKNALAGNFAPLTPVPRKATNTEKWLLDQVLPVLRRMVEQQSERGEWQIFDAYHGTLQSFLFERNKRK